MGKDVEPVSQAGPQSGERVSLVEASLRTGRLLQREPFQPPPSAHAGPGLEELAECLYFAPGDGRIWLDQQRVVLMQASTFGAMRREMVQSVGMDKAREMLERIGYAQGQRDAQLVSKRWGDREALTQWRVGPRLHALQGFLKGTPISHQFDVARGTFRAEFLWQDSVEADEHLAAFGLGDEAGCWMTAAYASGYASTQFGRLILFRETACRCKGDAQCRVEARTADEWGEGERRLGCFTPGLTAAVQAAQREASVATPAALPVAAPAGQAASVIGLSAPFVAARQQLERVAPTEATVLLRGESGAGKELFASTLHQLSRRRKGPFIAVNCAALPDELVEAELFGVERGAFTGATHTREGRFERAHGGTLFLDEIASMSASAQGKLLRALQERQIERVGGTRSIEVDVRVVAATNVDLWSEVEARRFRRDLFFRLNVFPITLPALRERRDDIPFLLDHFLNVYRSRHDKPVAGFTHRAMSELLNYNYPGNVRELQNLVERGVICAEPGGLIDSAHVFRQGERVVAAAFALGQQGRLEVESAQEPQSLAEPAGPGVPASATSGVPVAPAAPATGHLIDVERRLCLEALRACAGNVAAAARQLGLTRPTLEYRLRKWGELPQPRLQSRRPRHDEPARTAA